MSNHTPDVWVIVELASTEYDTIYKILSGWYGGYLGTNEWRLSSGITYIVEHEDHWEIHNESGSVYKCLKGIERTSTLTEMMFNSWLDQADENTTIRKVPIEGVITKVNFTPYDPLIQTPT